MQPTDVNVLLLRVLVAVAWADGKIDREEEAFLRGLVAEYGVTGRDAEELSLLLREPVSIEQYTVWATDFLRSVSPDDRTRALARAEKLIEADRSRSREELRYLHLLREWIAEAAAAPSGAAREGGSAGTPPLLGRLGRLLGKAGPASLGTAVRSLLGQDAPGSGISTRDAYVALFGAILYRVIYADRVVDAAEAACLRSLLAERFGFAEGEVDYILRLIQRRVAKDHDRQHLCAEFNRVTGLEERIALLEALFEMAKADGEVGEEEEREIRLVSNYLWIEVQDYVASRRRVLGR